jgi:hypothetical protein
VEVTLILVNARDAASYRHPTVCKVTVAADRATFGMVSALVCDYMCFVPPEWTLAAVPSQRTGEMCIVGTKEPQEPLVAAGAEYICTAMVAVRVSQDAMLVEVATLTGQVYKVPCTATCTIGDLKEVMQEITSFAVSWQRLLFRREELDNKRTLADVGVTSGDRLHLFCTFGM